MPSCYTIQVRRGLQADRTSYTPESGEWLYTTDDNKLYMGDGSTAGGTEISSLGSFGTMSKQGKTAVDIDGGTIDGTSIGATTPGTGAFTSLTSTLNAAFGDGSAEVKVTVHGGGANNDALIELETDTAKWVLRNDESDNNKLKIEVGGTVYASITTAGLLELTKLGFGTSSEVTISTGAVTLSGGLHTIDTEADAATDDLDTVNGLSDGEVAYLKLENDSRVVTVKHGTGNISLADDKDLAMEANVIYAAMKIGSTVYLIGGTGSGGQPWGADGQTLTGATTLTALDANTIIYLDAGSGSASYDVTLPALADVSYGDCFTFVGAAREDLGKVVTDSGSDIIIAQGRRLSSTDDMEKIPLAEGEVLSLFKAKETMLGDDAWIIGAGTILHEWNAPHPGNMLKHGRVLGGAVTDAAAGEPGFRSYDDGAVTEPVDGVGGAGGGLGVQVGGPSTSQGDHSEWSISIVKTATDRQGQGMSTDIQSFGAQHNQTVRIRFFSRIEAGDTLKDGDIELYMYDVDNAEMHFVGQMDGSTGYKEFFFGLNDSDNWRLCWHVPNTDTNSYSLHIEDLYVGPNNVAQGFIGGDIQTYTGLTITASSNPSKGTVVVDEVSWRRVGNCLEAWWQYEQSSSGGGGTGEYTFELLSDLGLTADTSAIAGDQANNNVGTFNSAASGSPNRVGVAVLEGGGIKGYVTEDVDSGFIGAGFEQLGASTRAYGFHVVIPIQGWSSHGPQTVANEPYLWAERYAGSATRVTTTPSKLGEYRAWYKASNAAHGRGTDTAPTAAPSSADGLRLYADPYGSAGTSGEPNAYQIYVGKHLALVQLFVWQSSGRAGAIDARGSYNYRSDGGSLVEIGIYIDYDPATGVVTVDGALSTPSNQGDLKRIGVDKDANQIDDGYFDLLVTPKTNALALTKEALVHVEASSDAGQAVTASTEDFQYEDVSINTHGAWQTDKFVAPKTTEYAYAASVAWTSATNFNFEVRVDGTIVRETTFNGSADHGRMISGTIRLAAGEELSFRHDAGLTRNTDVERNWVCITEVS